MQSRLGRWVALGGLVVLLPLAPNATAQQPAREIRISMTDYRLQPNAVELRAGETVRLTLVNASRQKEHELMAGRGVVKGGPFGDRPDGYEVDFFEGVTVEIVDVKGAKDVVAGKAKLIGKAPGQHMGGMQMGADMHGEDHQGFMIELEPGGAATIAFTVPKGRAGRWEMGCFSEDGQHYGEGMKGAWEVKG